MAIVNIISVNLVVTAFLIRENVNFNFLVRVELWIKFNFRSKYACSIFCNSQYLWLLIQLNNANENCTCSKAANKHTNKNCKNPDQVCILNEYWNLLFFLCCSSCNLNLLSNWSRFCNSNYSHLILISCVNISIRVIVRICYNAGTTCWST